MICDPLARTGLDANPGLLVVVALLCLSVGAAMLLTRRRKRAAGAAAVLVLALTGLAIGPVAPARAAGSECVSAVNTLTVTQTSTMRGLAPGVASRPITGVVANNGTEATHIAAVNVEITSVTTAAGAQIDGCTAADFVLLDAVMPVRSDIAAGASTPFSGASLGFANRPIEQDACRNVTVHLRYTANP